MKYISADRMYGFVDCDQVSQLFDGKDVFIGEHELLQARLQKGDHITYKLGFTKRADPQANSIIVSNRVSSLLTVIWKAMPYLPVYNMPLSDDSVTVFPGFVCSLGDMTAYTLIEEQCRVAAVPRLANSHMGIRNSRSPIVVEICRKIQHYFNMNVGNTVVSIYPSASSYRPFHQDRFRDEEQIAVIASFGGTRELIFQHLQFDSEECIAQQNGMLTVFGRALNTRWAHGILPEPGARPRLSVTMWGRVRGTS